MPYKAYSRQQLRDLEGAPSAVSVAEQIEWGLNEMERQGWSLVNVVPSFIERDTTPPYRERRISPVFLFHRE